MESGRNSLIMESGGSVKPEAGAAANQALLGRLLAMAHRYRSEGNLRQATELYWTLVDDYPGTSQANAARVVLLELWDRVEALRPGPVPPSTPPDPYGGRRSPKRSPHVEAP